MWLLKKFWKTDIIGKIYISIILFIIIVTLITVITRYSNSNKKDVEETNDNNIQQLSQIETVETKDIENETTDNINTENSIIQEDIPKADKNIQSEKIDTKKNDNLKDNKSIDTNSKTVEQNNPSVKQEIPKEEIIEKPVKEEIKPAVPIENKEEYRVNTTMIETIKSFINNNPSEDMKNYSFKVVVDSSITKDTNEFTFSEYRLKSKIEYKFGTIKIYAQDYFRNGQFVRTQCFII